ncbi:FecR domain-containing protein [Pseudomonas batumici]|uniref:FecR family protein n=1 Tax=Pseudomonas batumici TaxID=226910 RepID=UPI0030D32F47
MTDSQDLRPPASGQVPHDAAMDQALDWLIVMECPTAEQQAAFDTWHAADLRHAQAYARASAAWNAQPVFATAQLLQQQLLQQRRRPSLLRRLRPHWKPLATAAALLIALGSYGNLPLRLQADHLTVVGERQHLQLEDGSKVLLNTNSAFSSSFSERQHKARLYKGEAFFDVAAEREQPLEIDAGPVRASVSDTSFAVRYLDGEAQVQVQRGDVDLRTLDDSARLRLSAGNSVRVGPHGFGPPEKLDAQKDLAWVQGRLVFENCPLNQVLAELRRYYPGWIVNNNEHLAQVAVTGNYRLDKPLDVVRALAQITSAKLSEYPALVILN